MIRRKLTEGGSLDGVGAIHIDEIKPTLMPLQRELGINLIDNTLGSVGKRTFSGDIDVAVDMTREQLPELIERLEASPLVSEVRQSSVVMCKVKIQNYDPNRETDRVRTGYVQVDFMPGDPGWMKTYYHSPTESESKYKGVFRNILLSIAAAHLDRRESDEKTDDGRPMETERYLWGANGLSRVVRKPVPRKSGTGFTKQNKNIVIAGPWTNPGDIVRVMKLDSVDDLNSYESLKKAIERNYDPKVVREILTAFRDNSIVQDIGVPDDIDTTLLPENSTAWFRAMLRRLS